MNDGADMRSVSNSFKFGDLAVIILAPLQIINTNVIAIPLNNLPLPKFKI